MSIDPRISSVAATGVNGLIARLGGDPGRVLAAAGVAHNEVEDDGALLGLSAYCAMFEQAARQTGVESFGLHFGRDYRIEDMGPLGRLVLSAPTLWRALENLCRYFPALQEHSTLRLIEQDGLVGLTYQIRDGRIGLRRQDAELSLAVFSNLFRVCHGKSWAPVQVNFEHERAATAAEHETVFAAPVYFSQNVNAILFRKADLAALMPQADTTQMAMLQTALAAKAADARPDDFIGQLTQQIRSNFHAGNSTINAAASGLGLSRASLYRTLAARGLEFSAVRQTIRQELALRYVGQPHIPLTEIAQLLGYSELSAFSRAFSRWTGLSPVRYRQSQCQQPASFSPAPPAPGRTS